MQIIGENIHIISPRVKEAIAAQDIKFFQESAVKQVEAGAAILDLNIGPQKKAGHEILPWLVKGVQAVVDVPLSLDTTNLAAIEEGLKVARNQCIINSSSAEEERLELVPPLAKAYNAKLIALTMGKSGIPVSAEERVNIALEYLIPRAVELDMPMADLLIDPLVLTVSGCQEYCPECIEAVRILKVAGDPPPMTNAGLSNVSNAVPREMRPLINRVYGVMLMAKTENALKAPPENRSRSPKRVPLSKSLAICSVSTPGTGMCVPMRKTRNIQRVKRILFRRSDIRIALLSVWST